jgi:hypothetical protein
MYAYKQVVRNQTTAHHIQEILRNTVHIQKTQIVCRLSIYPFIHHVLVHEVHEITFCVLSQAVRNGGTLQEIGMLLYHLASKIKVQICHFIPVIVEYIVANKINSQQQIDGKYLFYCPFPLKCFYKFLLVSLYQKIDFMFF